MLKVDKISKSYGNVSVLKNVSFSIKKGEFVSLVGQSGSGKTTLLKIISGYLQADSGTVSFNEELLEGPKNKLLPGHAEIKLVFQDYALKPNMTVAENLNYALIGFTEAYKKERTSALLDICKLTELTDRYPNELSGGQQQRVAFCRALATEPEIILMDEPFSNLDPLTKFELLQETKSLASLTKTSIMLVTHDTRDAMEAADRIMVLQGGQLIQQASPEKIYDHPKNPDVARLFGLVNVLDVQDVTRLNIPFQSNGKTAGIWAEDVQPANQGLPVRVAKAVYAGHCHKTTFITQSGIKLIGYDYTKSLKEGDETYVRIDPNRIMEFD